MSGEPSARSPRRRTLLLVATLAVAVLVAVGVAALRDLPRRRLEENLEREMRDELERMPERRPALREPRAEGELFAALDAALRQLPKPRIIPGVGNRGGFAFDDDEEESLDRADAAAKAAALAAARPFLVELRKALSLEKADFLAAIRRAAAEEKAAVSTRGPTLLFLPGEPSKPFERARSLLELAARDALANGRALEAAQLALDLWQLEHDRVRRDPLLHASGPEVAAADAILIAALRVLDTRDLETIAGELDRLEAGTPRCRDIFRRRRILSGTALRALPRTLEETELPGWEKVAESPDVFWPRLNAVLELAEEASSEPTHGAALERVLNGPGTDGPVGTLAGRLVSVERQEECEDLTRIRAARLFARVRIFERANGRPPASLAAALGRAPGPGEADLYDGSPLELEVDAEGKVRILASRFATGFED